MPDTSTPVARVAEYLRQRPLGLGQDPENISEIWFDVNAESIRLTASDLEEILDELDALRQQEQGFLDNSIEPTVYILDDNHVAAQGLQPAPIRFWLSPDTAVDVEASDDLLTVRVPPKGITRDLRLLVLPVSPGEFGVETEVTR